MPLFGRKKTDDPAPRDRTREPLPPPPEPGPSGLRSMEDHRDYLLGCLEPLPAFSQHVLDALGLSLCEDVHSAISMPRFDNSAMDGYAVRAADVAGATEDAPVSLPVVGEVAAGQDALHRLSPGTAIKIMTGAPLPDHADAVVPYEATDRGTSDVRVFAPSGVGQHVRYVGEDVLAGAHLFSAGQQIGPRDVGLLAGIGRDTVLVRPRPRVAIVSTGTELVEPGQELGNAHQIYDSNSYLLAAAAREAGAHVFRVGLVSDDPEQVKQLITDQLVRADLVVSTGGVSQGDYDVVKAVMPELGATDFTQVAMQPGKPQGFGLVGDDRTPMIMLPGNPVSAFVSFEAFVRPAIRRLMGLTPYTRPVRRARVTHPISSAPGRQQLARGIATVAEDGSLLVELAGGHGSHLMADLARANVLVLLPADVTAVEAGQDVDVWLLDEVV
ncbi:MAG: Molybdopterin molybdenumtransferase [uncultured Friedmanniella sp.]|uniref:Molybdopterin molybdenumtransferase n=1 Tax=uncultured Friedmanniella sp. TaxID=335381 RepID=A0A6J4KJW5_9ACTN|nr:MAG: Molybdopterin molybdenumtransferase [uncultured Friedmanniella sp.]